MSTHILEQQLDDFRSLIDHDAAYFIKFAQKVSEHFNEVLDTYTEKNVQQFWNRKEAIAHRIINETKEFEVFPVVESASALKKHLDIKIQEQGEECIYTLLRETFLDIESTLNEVFRTYSSDSALQLASKAKLFISDLYTFLETSTTNIKSLYPHFLINEKEELLSIYLNSNEIKYIDVLAKLQSIQSFYSELCQLLNISEVDFPLKVVKIETGSFWLLLLGKKDIFAFVRACIENSANYIYRNYTNEGKISNIPKKVEAAESVFKLREQLASSNPEIDISELDEKLKKSTILIAENLNLLLSEGTSISVDNKIYPLLGDRNEPRKLMSQHQKRLQAAVEEQNSLPSSETED